MSTENKHYQTAMQKAIEMMQEFDFKNMNDENKKKFFEFFLDMEKKHARWAYNQGYADGKMNRDQDFNTYYKTNHNIEL